MNIPDGARTFAGVEQWLVLLCWCAANATGVDLDCNTSAKRKYFIPDVHTTVNGATSGHRKEIRGGGSWGNLARETAQGRRVDKSHSNTN